MPFVRSSVFNLPSPFEALNEIHKKKKKDGRYPRGDFGPRESAMRQNFFFFSRERSGSIVLFRLCISRDYESAPIIIDVPMLVFDRANPN